MRLLHSMKRAPVREFRPLRSMMSMRTRLTSLAAIGETVTTLTSDLQFIRTLCAILISLNPIREAYCSHDPQSFIGTCSCAHVPRLVQ